jgi:hypothetical protein
MPKIAPPVKSFEGFWTAKDFGRNIFSANEFRLIRAVYLK